MQVRRLRREIDVFRGLAGAYVVPNALELLPHLSLPLSLSLARSYFFVLLEPLRHL